MPAPVTRSGGCHCGAIRYEVTGEPVAVSICHCEDCRRCAGAPFVCWADFAEGEFRVTQGTLRTRNSSGAAMRSICGDCGSGIAYTNAEVLPGLIALQTATLDEPDAFAPTLQVQVAERLRWIPELHALPAHERYPGHT